MRQAKHGQVADAVEAGEKKWFIDESDLEFFISRVEGTAPVRADAWEPLLQKQIPNELVYRAYRRMLKDIRKTEYLSTSITCDTSPQEVRSVRLFALNQDRLCSVDCRARLNLVFCMCFNVQLCRLALSTLKQAWRLCT